MNAGRQFQHEPAGAFRLRHDNAPTGGFSPKVSLRFARYPKLHLSCAEVGALPGCVGRSPKQSNEAVDRLLRNAKLTERWAVFGIDWSRADRRMSANASSNSDASQSTPRRAASLTRRHGVAAHVLLVETPEEMKRASVLVRHLTLRNLRPSCLRHFSAAARGEDVKDVVVVGAGVVGSALAARLGEIMGCRCAHLVLGPAWKFLASAVTRTP
jgi:hypothetical protein